MANPWQRIKRKGAGGKVLETGQSEGKHETLSRRDRVTGKELSPRDGERQKKKQKKKKTKKTPQQEKRKIVNA